MLGRSPFVMLAMATSLVVPPVLATAADAAPKHSLQEYAYLVGAWQCTAHTPGKPDASYRTSMRWLYPEHTAIDQRVVTPRGQADFILTYDKASDSFKGIFVGSDGGVGVWENPGPVDGGWTEYGYDFKGDDLVPATRATFNGATPRHYAFRYWSIRNKRDPGKLLETDDCNKLS